jgi:hypothetical protein
MPNIDMTKVIALAEQDEFWATRGKAIQAYANLEQSLSSLFSCLSGTSARAASTILFRISSSDSRNKILEQLFRQKFQNGFNLFRNSLFDQLRPIDLERNEIVHWNAVCQMGLNEQAEETAEVFLMPPASLTALGKETPTKKNKAIQVFSIKCGFYSALINMFCVMEGNVTQHPVPDDVKLPWRDIFSQPIAYPPPLEHPLFQKNEVLENHIQAFLV